jgi:hypothetical protein
MLAALVEFCWVCGLSSKSHQCTSLFVGHHSCCWYFIPCLRFLGCWADSCSIPLTEYYTISFIFRESSAPQFRHDRRSHFLTEWSTPTASPYIREEAGSHRYNVGTDTPKLCATSCGAGPLANSFLAA